MVIPAIDLIDGKCVRLLRGDYETSTVYGDPVAQALRFQEAGFRRLHVVDLEGAKSGGGENRKAIERIVQSSNMPVQVGGGIRQREDVDQVLDFGVRWLIIGTLSVKDPETVSDWIREFGPEPFIVSLDLRGGKLQTEGWLESAEIDLVEMVRRIREWGVRWVISTDVEKDGTLLHPGYDQLKLLRGKLPENCDLIAAGGVSAPEHISELARIGVRHAIVGRAMYEGAFSPEQFASAS